MRSLLNIFNEKIVESKSNTELDIECELIIAEEKQENGRVSTLTMRLLREKYGSHRADRAMFRQQKKRTGKNKNMDLLERGLSILAELSNNRKPSL